MGRFPVGGIVCTVVWVARFRDLLEEDENEAAGAGNFEFDRIPSITLKLQGLPLVEIPAWLLEGSGAIL
jgi:hypothetical protein